MTLAGRRVVLGVSGGIASYKSCTIARRLTDAGVAVDVVLTASAAEFVRPVTFEALTRRPVLTSLWERGRALTHIDLARDPDLIVIAPATANLLARAAQGMADDLLTAILLAATVPVMVAPGMNDEMFAHPATQWNLSILRQRGWTIVGPAVGPLAEGPSERPGRMAEPEEIMVHIERLLRAPDSGLQGKRVLVTAGPTREHLDPVRVITNPSSGRMGYSIAEAAFARGADVVLVSGPTTLPPPTGAEMVHVTTTNDLLAAVEQQLPNADILVMAAAPADFRPIERNEEKRPRDAGQVQVTLEPTQDVLESTLNARREGSIAVGFALEVADGVRRARQKLERKCLDLVVLNQLAEPGSGFEAETNRITLITKTDTRELELMAKRQAAERVLDEVERLL
ncbi:MAG: bifunctional phosphopantothenoylcysteine decarboxylase/phosphopantothenate--cysteine ligase CoaBC [Gemmatimonadales bacterium]|nr:bifunctional phosphopantothenoylcysteine decarboxylase/phosphopantothenate--cysteine ligase CoaBC [Gemmatimonadales bacterium]NIN50139.1 bifunctional phosphopantothenoylcysteine decarboxylase/phosphopantothenate--cysteine ligase CoaBC [Gemmatimonadales bacterium]NIP07603.1 bifunctional phosphopantothenoylcysteine decarboxylase/phosphopantothenate--cysteine ligase CoaBC [Gemmatimonadales bacterium]NIR01755.1 bifunctional phosphopantothenoylcysteine decarboxylase/phosphopantothenate--cysteine l